MRLGLECADCLREARCTVKHQKPITLVYDPVRGGEKLEVIKRDECSDEFREIIFSGRTIIEWHRIKVCPAKYSNLLHFMFILQPVTLRTNHRTFSW